MVIVPGVRLLIGLRGYAEGLPARGGTVSAMASFLGDVSACSEACFFDRTGAILSCRWGAMRVC